MLCELIWVVRRSYRASKEDQVLLLKALLDDELLEIEDRKRVVAALEQFEAGGAGFVDYLIGTRNRRLGASTTYTFDRALGQTDGFTSL